MGKFIDLTGQTFGNLSVIRKDTVRTGVSQSIRWVCSCVCGTEKSVSGVVLREGKSKSCGCMQGSGRLTHGASKTLTFSRWSGMWSRVSSIDSYKGRAPPDAWKDFEVFLRDMGECPEGYSLERKDNNAPYSAGNCVWIPKECQAKNTTRTVRVVLKDGTEVCLADAARHAGIKYATVKSRIFSGWSVEEALNGLGKATAASEV